MIKFKLSRRHCILGGLATIALGCTHESKPVSTPRLTNLPLTSSKAAALDASAVDDRILFPGNPWPKGHVIKEFAWCAEMTGDGLVWCHLHLESDNYYADDGDEKVEEAENDVNWQSRIVWGNYHSCTLSSTMWGHAGFLIGSPQQPVDIEELSGQTFLVDEINDGLNPAVSMFGIYLQGHDTVADHAITFRKIGQTWTIDWTASVALTYLGGLPPEGERLPPQAFANKLIARKTGVTFAGVNFADDVKKGREQDLLSKSFVNPGRFTRQQADGGVFYKYSPTE